MRKLSRLLAGGVAAAVWCGAAAGAAPARAAGFDKKTRERAERTLRAGEFESAEKMYRELLAKDARDSEARLGLSLALLKQRKHSDAYDQAARVVAADPLSARAHALLGTSLLGAGDFRLSVEEFRTALTLRDDDAMAIAGLAMVDFYENRLAASLTGLRRAAFIDPSEPDYVFNLGQVASRYERYAEAAAAYETFLRVAPRTDADRRARIQGLIDFLRYLGRQTDLLAVAGPPRAVVPFELVNNRPIIEVRINNSKEPLRFVVDTGAGMCVLSTAAADRMGLRPVARGGQARAVGGEGRFEIIYGFLQSLHVGEARVDRVPVYIRQFFNDKEPVDGYIGLSVLGKYLTTVDYAGRAMTLLRGEALREAEPPGAAAVEVPMRTTSSGFWSGEVRLEGVEKPTNFIIDTGASVTVVSEALAAREGLERYAQKQVIRVYGAAGLAENIPTLTLPSLALTPAHVRRNVYAAVLDMESLNETAGFEQTGIVGGNILRHYRVTFDFARAVVVLDPYRAGAPGAADPRATAPVVSTRP
ncbi:MAG TPA: aspartyl protease family protein [Pyrinomonadaceae bacterium]|nr:aspartyl protease family protein [Pyrinomonadaceae bacterium]